MHVIATPFLLSSGSSLGSSPAEPALSTMVRHSVALVKVFQVLIAIPFLAIAYLILASHLQTAPLAAAISWTGTKIVQGTTSFAALGMVVALCSLACDARRWLTGVSPVS